MRYINSALITCLALPAVNCDGCEAPPPPGFDAGVGVPTTIALNEVVTRNETGLRDEAGEFDDWVELFNLTDAPIELDGFTLADSGAAPAPFPPGTVLDAGGFLVAFADDTSPGTPGEPHFPFKLAGEGDALILRDAAGEVVDTLLIPALRLDESFGRVPDGDAAAVVLGAPTPGEANVAAEGEGEGEGECEPPAPNDVVVNEVLVENESGLQDNTGNFEPWIELFNAGDADAALLGLVLADSNSLIGAWPLPDASLAPGAFLVVFADREADQQTPDELHASFLLSAIDPVVHLADICGTIVHSVSLADGSDDVSVGLLPDGDRNGAGARGSPTPGAPNN